MEPPKGAKGARRGEEGRERAGEGRAGKAFKATETIFSFPFLLTPFSDICTTTGSFP